MKKTLLALLLVLTGVAVMARPVDQSTAMLVARNFALSQLDAARRAALGDKPFLDAHVVYTHTMPASGNAAIYAVDLGTAFVLVSADDVAHPVLGYNLGRTWPKQTLAAQVSSFLDDLARQIESAVGNEPDGETAEEWQELLLPGSTPRPKDIPDSVGPLLTTTWDQGQYYNALCPEDPNGPDGHVLTGCVATAMAQIINYWGYPIHGRGVHSYNVSGLDPGSMCPFVNIIGYGTQTVNYYDAVYDYINMPEVLTDNSTLQEVSAVAQLMYHCGVAVDMFYDASASGAYDENVRCALISYFGFTPSLGYAERIMYTDAEWDDSLRANIDRGEPVFYSGSSVMGGAHAFVLDGYKQDGYFHFNFGWGGSSDGWYLSSAVNVGWGYNEWQSAIMGIRPDYGSRAEICHRAFGVQDIDTFVVSDPIDLYPLRGGSSYSAQNELSGARINLNLVPEDSAGQLVIDVIDFGNENSVAIYDGINKDSLLRVIETRELDSWNTVTYRTWFYEGLPSDTVLQNMANTDFSPIVSTRHGFSIVVYSYGGIPDGFRLRVRNATDTTAIDATGVNNRIYWTDVVTSEPEGYLLEGNIIRVSSAEALAWVAKCVDSIYLSFNDAAYYQYTHHDLSIDNDIDLRGYIWKPIRRWFGTINGNGHIIKNMEVNSYGFGGLFSSLFYTEISNIGLVNSKVNAISGAGSLTGYLSNCNVINCFSENFVVSGSSTSCGGMFGCVGDASVINNCYAYGNVSAQFGYGGLVGYFSNSEVSNCVTQVGRNHVWSYRINPAEWRGLFTEEVHGGIFSNCYSDISTFMSDNVSFAENRIYGFLGNLYNVDVTENLAAFNISVDTLGLLMDDISVNYTLGDNMDVVTALNNKVAEYNSPNFRTWVRDSATHLPVFGNYYVVTCPNVSDIVAENIPYNGSFAVALSWQENGEATEWQVKCRKIDESDDSAIVFSTNVTNDTIENLQLGNDYYFYVRPLCGGTDTVGWGQPLKYYVDKTLWIDVVTSRPDGYEEGENGNVTISSPEGLAWLAKYGGFNYREDTIFIVNDLDMGSYRWTPLGRAEFRGVIEGYNHVISNIYCSESIKDPNSDKIGLIGYANYATMKNIVIKDAFFSGYSYVGSLVGWAWNSKIVNCHAINTVVRGVSEIGILGGGASTDGGSCITYNCSATGSVYADLGGGGLFGGYSPRGEIKNCYSNCDIRPLGIRQNGGRGGFVCGGGGFVSNCYGVGNVGVGIGDEYVGSFMGGFNSELNGEIHFVYTQRHDDLPFIGGSLDTGVLISDTSYIENGDLQPSVTISGISYTNLLDALNAWVDTYDTAGIYRHWAPDTTNVNGGFPVFAALPCLPTTGSDSIIVCDSYTWHGVEYTDNALLVDTLSKMNGCDSIVTHHLIINHSNAGSESVTNCESYFFNGQWIYASGQYYDTLTNVAGCDSVVTLNLTINNPVHTAVTEMACDSYLWHEATLTSTGDYTYPHNDANGCTQVDTLHLVINYSSLGDTTAAACDRFSWYQHTDITESTDMLTHTFVNAAGCDSTVNLHLTINYSNTGDTTVVACDRFSWYQHTDITESTHMLTHTFINVAGCDSTVTLYLTINRSNNGDTAAVACDRFTWWNTNYTNSTNEATHVLTNVAGCDSTVTLHLMINHSNDTTITETIVQNQLPYTFSGESFNGSENRDIMLSNIAGCDSVIHYTLNVEWNSENTADSTVCASQLPLVWNGVTFNTAGTQPVTLTGSNGADSVVIMTLNIFPQSYGDTSATACESFEWYGETYNASGNYTHTLTAADRNGCDSIVTLMLTINHNGSFSESITSCDSLVWHGETFNQSGHYTFDTLTTSGCDSTVTLSLTIKHNGSFSESITACDSLVWHGETFNQSGHYTFDTLTTSGCDSTLTLSLTINHNGSFSESITACDSLVWHGETFNQSGHYTFDTLTTSGCDSTLLLSLTINHNGSFSESITSCDSFAWHGETFTQSGNYTFDTVTMSGCDSTLMLMLTINHSTTGVFTVRACDEYTWHRYTYYESTNEPTYTMPGSNECDSTVTLHLTINHSSTGDTAAVVCDGFDWNGQWIETSGQYLDTLTNVVGCDSTVTLSLTVNHSSAGDTAAVACDGFGWGGQWLVASGQYVETMTNVTGCDSTVTLHLTINYSNNGDTTAVDCDSYDWYGTSYTSSTTTTHIFTNTAGCDSTVTLHLTIHYSTENTDTVTSEDSYAWHGTNYDESGTYTWIGTTTEGCDSTVTLHLVIEQGGTEGIDDVETADNIKVYTRGKTIVIDFSWQQAADGRQSVVVYDVMGRVIKQTADSGHQAVVEIPVTSAGVYMVKVGEHPSRKVVVR